MNLLNKTPYIILLAISLVHAPSVHAYLDPGTGSMIVQMFLAAIAGVLVTINLWWHKIKSFFSSIFSRSEKGTNGTSDNNLE